MINIRRNIFETNSSSSHSISLSKPISHKRDDIPTNSIITLEPYDNPSAHGGWDGEAELFEYRTQLGKLRYLIHMIVSVLEEDIPYIYLTEYKDDDNWRYNKTKEHKENLAKKFFELQWFTWLKEMIKDKTGSTLNISYDIDTHFPFWETTYDEDDDLLTILGFNESSWNNEAIFKSKMSTLIFNDNVIIYDRNIPYGMSEIIKEF